MVKSYGNVINMIKCVKAPVLSVPVSVPALEPVMKANIYINIHRDHQYLLKLLKKKLKAFFELLLPRVKDIIRMVEIYNSERNALCVYINIHAV